MLRFLSALLFLSAPSLSTAVEMSESAPLAAKSLLLDVAAAGSNFVAVGDRGHVLLSTDDGQTWQQCAAPTRAMLTGVAFATPDRGWAVGHDGVILATTDGGRTWQRQDRGDDLDTVYLDVLFLDATRGFAVGAYGKFLATTDGGATWTEHRVAEEDFHFNRIVRAPNEVLYLLGEAGTFLVSTDGGTSWIRRALPYEGTLFAGMAFDDDRIVVGGLRGRILASPDRGETWREIPNPHTVLICASTRLADGTTVFAGQGGNFFICRAGEMTFTHWKPEGFGTSIAEIISTSSDKLISVGEAGVVLHHLP